MVIGAISLKCLCVRAYVDARHTRHLIATSSDALTIFSLVKLLSLPAAIEMGYEGRDDAVFGIFFVEGGLRLPGSKVSGPVGD